MPNIFPMLAHINPAPPGLLFDDSYWAQEKLDGERRLYHLFESDFSMTGRKVLLSGLISEVSKKVPHLHNLSLSAFKDTVLDGELMHPDGFSKLAQVMRSHPDKAVDIQKKEGYLVYHLYDMISYCGTSIEDLPYSQRYDVLTHFYFSLPSELKPFFRLVSSSKTSEHKQALYDRIMSDQSAEGLMFRHASSSYETGKRSASLLRLKKEFTEDVIVTDIIPPKRDYKGKKLDTWEYWFNDSTNHRAQGARPSVDYLPVTYAFFHDIPTAFSYAQFDKNMNLIPLGTCSGFGRDIAFDMKENPSRWLGAVVELKANERFKGTFSLRHPRFHRRRDDKDAQSCLLPSAITKE